jgi:DNA ligase-1
MPNVAVVGAEMVDLSTNVGAARFAEINASAVAGGYEGIMIKDPGAVYECKRTVSWLKQKPYIEVSLSVVDLEEGTGKNVGKLGALVCEGVDDGKEIRVNVGSGLTDHDRDSFWTDRGSVVGNIVEVRADAVTQNQDGTYSLRFPRFKGFRGFEPGEKL